MPLLFHPLTLTICNKALFLYSLSTFIAVIQFTIGLWMAKAIKLPLNFLWMIILMPAVLFFSNNQLLLLKEKYAIHYNINNDPKAVIFNCRPRRNAEASKRKIPSKPVFPRVTSSKQKYVCKFVFTFDLIGVICSF